MGGRRTEPARIEERAAENLAFIRQTLERSSRFTAVPGRTGVLLGAIAVAGAWHAHRQSDPMSWLRTWVATAVVGFVVTVVAIVAKSLRAGMPVMAGPGRKFAFALAPALGVATLLTIPLASNGQMELLPPLWLLLYGTAVTASGTFTIPEVGMYGVAYLFLGAAALFVPGYGDHFMAAGFGGLQAGFGLWIWRRYGRRTE
jgi:hypothetical protein